MIHRISIRCFIPRYATRAFRAFRRFAVCAIATLALATSACSTARFSRAQDCALVGGGVAVAGGIVYVATKNDVSGGEAAGVIGGTLVGGALVGYLTCVVTDTGP